MSHRHNIDVVTYTFPVIRGVQAGQEYFVSMIPYRLIPSLFLFNEDSVPPQMRAQRVLNKSRIPSMTRYLTENSRDYIFSSLTASIDRIVDFTPIPADNPNSRIGHISIPSDTRIVINDGQHRRAAIIEALKQKPELAYEMISVVFFIDMGLKRSQQMFSDLNRYASKPSGSLNILYDHRDQFSQMVLELINEVPIFKGSIELEKTSISNRSKKVFTLSSVYRANKTLLGSLHIADTEWKQTARDYWNEITSYMIPWKELLKGKPSYTLRKETIAVHDLSLQTIAIVGNYLLSKHPDEWKDMISGFQTIDWNRTNDEWNNRALYSGRLRKSYSNVVLTANLLKTKLGIQLSPKELEYEIGVSR